MKKFVSLLLLGVILTLFGCQKQDSSPTFEVGKIVEGACGNNFEMLISDRTTIMDEKATLFINVVMEKELDITDKTDYDGAIYKKYLYRVEITGKVNDKFANKSIFMHLEFAPEYIARGGDHGERGVVSENGDFSYTYTFRSNAVLTDWTPYDVIIQ